jgi:hypothetical protein
MGKQVSGPPLDEADTFFKCGRCVADGLMPDLAWVEDH